MYKIVLGMSYYIHSDGLGALIDGLRPVFKESTEGAGPPLPPPRCAELEAGVSRHACTRSPQNLYSPSMEDLRLGDVAVSELGVGGRKSRPRRTRRRRLKHRENPDWRLGQLTGSNWPVNTQIIIQQLQLARLRASYLLDTQLTS